MTGEEGIERREQIGVVLGVVGRERCNRRTLQGLEPVAVAEQHPDQQPERLGRRLVTVLATELDEQFGLGQGFAEGIRVAPRRGTGGRRAEPAPALDQRLAGVVLGRDEGECAAGADLGGEPRGVEGEPLGRPAPIALAAHRDGTVVEVETEGPGAGEEGLEVVAPGGELAEHRGCVGAGTLTGEDDHRCGGADGLEPRLFGGGERRLSRGGDKAVDLVADDDRDGGAVGGVAPGRLGRLGGERLERPGVDLLRGSGKRFAERGQGDRDRSPEHLGGARRDGAEIVAADCRPDESERAARRRGIRCRPGTAPPRSPAVHRIRLAPGRRGVAHRGRPGAVVDLGQAGVGVGVVGPPLIPGIPPGYPSDGTSDGYTS